MTRPQRGFWYYALSCLVLMSSGVPSLAWACTVCWGGNETLGWAFAVSGYVLLGTPFLILGAIVGGAWLIQQRVQRQARHARGLAPHSAEAPL